MYELIPLSVFSLSLAQPNRTQKYPKKPFLQCLKQTVQLLIDEPSQLGCGDLCWDGNERQLLVLTVTFPCLWPLLAPLTGMTDTVNTRSQKNPKYPSLFLACHAGSWTPPLKSWLLFCHYLGAAISRADPISPFLCLYLHTADPVTPHCLPWKCVHIDIWSGLFSSALLCAYLPCNPCVHSAPPLLPLQMCRHCLISSSVLLFLLPPHIPPGCSSLEIVFLFLQPFVVLFHLISSSLFLIWPLFPYLDCLGDN